MTPAQQKKNGHLLSSLSMASLFLLRSLRTSGSSLRTNRLLQLWRSWTQTQSLSSQTQEKVSDLTKRPLRRHAVGLSVLVAYPYGSRVSFTVYRVPRERPNTTATSTWLGRRKGRGRTPTGRRRKRSHEYRRSTHHELGGPADSLASFTGRRK